MREAAALSRGRHFILAHINAYCRGKTADAYTELSEAFGILRDHPQIIADSHLAVMNAAVGFCRDDIPGDHVTLACLSMLGLPQTREGIRRGIQKGLVRVIRGDDEGVELLETGRALEYYDEQDGKVWISFSVNIPGIGIACMTERRTPGGDFLIPLATTDGGYIPRNNLIHRLMLCFRLGYLSLDEVVRKCSLNPARVFALSGKGQLGKGADADITIVDPLTLQAVRSYIGGLLSMEKGRGIAREGCFLITEYGKKAAEGYAVPYRIVDTGKSLLYADL
jgi:hypothetical protein